MLVLHNGNGNSTGYQNGIRFIGVIMKRIFSFLLNPYALSLWVTLLVLSVFPLNIHKYTAERIENGEYMNDQAAWYDDLDLDGTAEKIVIFHNSIGSAGLTVSNKDGILDQWTFSGRYDFVQRPGIIITGDSDNDSVKEIYVFTLSNDSVLLHCLHDYKKGSVSARNRFVTRVGKRNNKTDPFILEAEMDDLTGDGSGELIFGIGTGYSLVPRRIYAWDIRRDTFLVSPRSGYFIKEIIQKDVTGDSLKEIILFGYAASNVRDSATPYPDWYTWLMVLDRDLRFMFNPVSFPGQYSDLRPEVILDAAHKPMLAALYHPPDNQGGSTRLMAFNLNGEIIQSLSLPGNVMDILSLTDRERRNWILLCREGYGFDVYDAAFKKKRSVKARQVSYSFTLDADRDGVDEVVCPDHYRNQLVIFRDNLRNPVTLEVDGKGELGMIYSLKTESERPAQLYLQMGPRFYLYEYGRNPVYAYRFGLYLAVYLGFLLFALLVRKIQQDQTRKKAETEKKITVLQLQILRNQLDPHFIMNAVNSIIATLSGNEQEKAREQLMHFSKLHRSLLLSSDQIKRSLQEEIEFTENYLALEKFRFRDKFGYTIWVDPLVDRQVRIPKMILQIHVENALRHGILPLEKGGMLKVNIMPVEKGLMLEITDNGIGRKQSRLRGSDSTGKGLALIEQYSNLFDKYHNMRITSEITDLVHPSGDPSGTKVKITLTGINEQQ